MKMKKAELKTKNHMTVAYVKIDDQGLHTITDRNNRILGYYDPKTNRTTDRNRRLVGYGYMLPRLVSEDLAEDGAGIIKPKPPLTARQAEREAQRRAGVQDRLHDEQRRHAEKVADLQAKLTHQ